MAWIPVSGNGPCVPLFGNQIGLFSSPGNVAFAPCMHLTYLHFGKA